MGLDTHKSRASAFDKNYEPEGFEFDEDEPNENELSINSERKRLSDKAREKDQSFKSAFSDVVAAQ